MIEFAAILPLLVLLVFGITEYGRALYEYDTLAKSVRSAVRHLSEKASGDLKAQAAARCLAVYGSYSDSNPSGTSAGDITCGSVKLLPNLTPAMVDICDAVNASQCPGQPHATVSTDNGNGTANGPANLVTVRITAYPFNSLFEFVLSDLTFGSAANYTGIAATMRQDL